MDYTLVSENRVTPIGKDMPLDKAALLGCAVATGAGTVINVAKVEPGSTVVVFGAGPIGLCAMLVCKASGAPVIVTEPQPYRRQLAADLGADMVIDPAEGEVIEQVMDQFAGRGATLVLECSGSDGALGATIDVVAKEGRIVLIGHSIGRKVPIEIGKSIWQGASFIGSCDSPFFFPKTLEFMSRRLVDVTGVITHRFPLADVLEAFELGKRVSDSAKILLIP